MSHGILHYSNRTNEHNHDVIANTPAITFIHERYPVRYQIRLTGEQPWRDGYKQRPYIVEQQYLKGYNRLGRLCDGPCVGERCGVDGWVDCAGTNPQCMLLSMMSMTTIIEEQKELLNEHLFNCAEAENKALTLATKLLTFTENQERLENCYCMSDLVCSICR